MRLLEENGSDDRYLNKAIQAFYATVTALEASGPDAVGVGSELGMPVDLPMAKKWLARTRATLAMVSANQGTIAGEDDVQLLQSLIAAGRMMLHIVHVGINATRISLTPTNSFV